ncbi:MAG: hypothetical protein CVU69_11700 [Deltaproteobacteria bacterium HGW-Deltaproteobacteria-4]|nr:MAG: hypothetical protein CVU69_11700 [Deltaproteobacteria bacterium HGW-Deltaproteobacteria-4]
MKKTTALFLTVIFVVFGAMTPSARAEHFGPVRSFLTAGELSLGVGGGVLHDTWTAGGDSLFRQKTAYAKVGFGLGSAWALGLRGGVVDMDSVTGVDFSSSPVPFVGATVGGPIYQGKTLSLGPVVQVSYVLKPFDNDGVEIEDMIKASVAFMAQLELEDASLYFGPTLSFGDATATGNVDLELSKRYAGVMGIRWRLPDNWPTNESKTFLDFELSNDDFQLNRSDLTVELNVTF